MTNYFERLNSINVKDKIEKKNNLSYLSWAYAWGELKKLHPDATYNVYENDKGYFYHTDGNTCWVKTGVTANGIEHIEYLPVMDFRNQSIPAAKVTSFDVNKTVQRSLTKAIARHGLGLYIYAGEDLPEDDTPKQTKKQIAEDTFKPDPLDRQSQEAARDSAIRLLNACATVEKLKEVWVKNQPKWSAKLDKDLYEEIETCKDHNKQELEKVA